MRHEEGATAEIDLASGALTWEDGSHWWLSKGRTGSTPDAAEVLFALDLGFECLAEGRPDRAQVANARLLLTRRLWPELGDLLGLADDPEG